MSVNVIPTGLFIYRYQGRLIEVTPEQMHHTSPIVSPRQTGSSGTETWRFMFTAELADGSEAVWQVDVDVGPDYPWQVHCRGAQLPASTILKQEDFVFTCGHE